MSIQSAMSASEFYALSQGTCCEGDVVCHYCHAPCKRLFLHHEPPPVPFARSTTTAKKPESPWQCQACWLWRRKRITVDLLSGGFKDGQCLLKVPTLITPEYAFWVDMPACKEKLYELLLNPPLEFALSLQEGPKPPDNLLQLQMVNSHKELKSSTELFFTVNNIQHSYTVHELEETLDQGDDGRMPGARAILRILGPTPRPIKEDVKEKLPRGRPSNEDKLEQKDPRDGKQDRVIKTDLKADKKAG